ncbi:MAG TPA: VOC family protein [Candidatus Dormibacteraeota bacterium]
MKARIDHIGIVVRDMEPAQRFAREVLGLELKLEPPPSPNRTAFLAWDGDATRVELVDLADQGERSRRLGDAEGRLDHVAVEVDDLEAAIAELKARGVELTTDEPVAIRNIRTVWTRPETTGGVMWQVFSPAS